ncbi:MAG: FecR domain-containing protein [Elusimicrobia bacterium]|nr:FecR domain-containing protein [Elusimicrobiota bacterium]
MRRKVLSALFVLMVYAGASTAFAAAAPAAPAPGVKAPPPAAVKPGQIKAMAAYIGDLQGEAKILLDGVEPWIDAKPAQKLTAGTRVKTEAGGSLTVVFTDGSKVKLGPNATFKIEEITMSKVAVYIGLGKLDAWVGKLKGRLFQARNPVAVASVRGTIFSMDVVSPTQAMMQCFQGALSVADNFGRTQAVEAGQQLAATSVAGTAEPPTALPPDAAPPVEPVITLPEVLAVLAAAAMAPAPAPTTAPPPAEEVPAEETAPAEEVPPPTTEATAPNPVQEASVAPPPDTCPETSSSSPSSPCP